MYQANTRWLKKNGLEEHSDRIKEGIERLWTAPNAEQFASRSVEFTDLWRPAIPHYVDYFERMWLKRHKPDSWASFGRPNDAPSGMSCHQP